LKKKHRFLIVIILIFILLSAIILNLKVSYYQGINYKIRQARIPLYLKIIDFFSRHSHYQELALEITGSSKSEEEKVFKLFEWTLNNIRNIPEGFPAIDDHVWNIIIRGYGADDQSHDVFTTLCNYAGVKAFFTWISSIKGRRIPFSFVRIKERWFIFDPFNGVYFRDAKGRLADIDTIKTGDYLIDAQKERLDRGMMDYSSYIENLPSIKNIGLRRANTQSPVNRLLLEIKAWINNH
jgi:hypothetical protein